MTQDVVYFGEYSMWPWGEHVPCWWWLERLINVTEIQMAAGDVQLFRVLGDLLSACNPADPGRVQRPPTTHQPPSPLRSRFLLCVLRSSVCLKCHASSGWIGSSITCDTLLLPGDLLCSEVCFVWHEPSHLVFFRWVFARNVLSFFHLEPTHTIAFDTRSWWTASVWTLNSLCNLTTSIFKLVCLDYLQVILGVLGFRMPFYYLFLLLLYGVFHCLFAWLCLVTALGLRCK